jgi:short-subunit dehydrogenase
MKLNIGENKRLVAVITGASRGIGAATARALARKGYALVLASRSEADLHELASELEALGGICLVVPMDIRSVKDIRHLAKVSVEYFGRVDVLLNNAGIVHPGILVSGLTDEHVASVIETNLLGSIELTRALLPTMLSQGSGFIGFVDSVGGHIAIPSASLYSATKFGLRGFAGALRREVKAQGIQVSIISPGFIATRLTEDVREIFDKIKVPMGTPEQVANIILKVIDHPQREIIFPGYYRLFAWFERNTPWMIDFVASRYLTRVLPKYAARHTSERQQDKS